MKFDALSIFGLCGAFIAIAAAQYVEGSQISALFNPSALIVVLGGTLGAVMLQTPRGGFAQALRMLPKVFRQQPVSFRRARVNMIDWSRIVRKTGLIALEKRLQDVTDPFTIKALELLITGADKNTIVSTMEIELDTTEIKLNQATQVFESMGGYCPTIGILGAVLGLIHVMQHLNSPAELGAGIAVAFLATIYGVGLANLVFLPIARKLKSQIQVEIRLKEMIIEGIGAIAEGESPRSISNRLQGFSPNGESDA